MMESNPIGDVGYSEFLSKYSFLFESEQVYISEFEKGLIKNCITQLWLHNRKHRAYNSDDTVKQAFRFMRKGVLINPEMTLQSFINIANKITPTLNKCMEQYKIASEKKDPDELIRNYLSYYKVLYEGLCPIIFSPIITGYGLSKKLDKNEFAQDSYGKIQLSILYKIEERMQSVKNSLIFGLNSHLRNAYSHEHFIILDGGKVNLWDINPKTKEYSWGPEVWDLKKIIELCEGLWINSMSIILSLMLFSIKHRTLISELNLVERESIGLRVKELKNSIEYLLQKLGFMIIEHKRENNILTLKIHTLHKGIDQNATIYAGGTIARKFIQKIENIETSVIEQVLGFLQHAEPLLEGIERIEVTVFDSAVKDSLGHITALIKKISLLKGNGNLEDDLKQLEQNTINISHKMFVEIKHTPIEV